MNLSECPARGERVPDDGATERAESMLRLELDGRFEFEGHTIRYGILGAGPPVVLLHGTPFSSQVWRRIAPYLAETRRVYYFDLLGYGRSDMPEGQDVSLGVQDRLFAALLRHWALRAPDVIAHDFGAATALRAALMQGVRYRSLLLIDPVALSPWGSSLIRHVREYEQAFTLAPAGIHEALLAAYIRGAAVRSLSPEVLQLHMRPWLGGIGQAAFYRQIAQMDPRYTEEVETRYGELGCPVRILWGEQDAWIPAARGQDLAQRIPGASLRIIPAAGHLLQEDAPEAVVSLALRWLEHPH